MMNILEKYSYKKKKYTVSIEMSGFDSMLKKMKQADKKKSERTNERTKK